MRFVLVGLVLAAPAAAQDGSPVSLGHIRDGLSRPAGALQLKRADAPADFRIDVREQQKIDEIIARLDFRSGPVPPGGLYGYAQQQRLANPTDYPLAQPYAAFSGGELVTIALENLVAHYLVPRITQAVGDAQRAHAEQIAREEVARSIASYCADRPDRADIVICGPATQ